MIKTQKIYIKGMRCASCEKLLDSEIRNTNNVKDVKVSLKDNSAEIFYEDSRMPDFSGIENLVRKLGYEISKNDTQKTNPAQIIGALFVAGAILFLFNYFQNSGLIDKIKINPSKITYGVSFLIGVVASLSSCLAVVGSVVIAFGEKFKSGEAGFLKGAIKPNLFFHIGRITTFFILGGILGLVGGEISVSGNTVALFTILVAIIMAWLGLNIIGLLPSISRFGVRMPSFLTGNWDRLKESEHMMAPFLLGGLSFFLPCGFTQSMQIFALASGSFWTGAVTLLLFAIGTSPVLMILGVATSWTKNKGIVVFQKAAGFLVLIFAFYTFFSGLSLLGVKDIVLTSGGNSVPSVENNFPADSEQVVEMKIGVRGFEPSVLKIKRDVPVKWVINGERVSGCSNRIIIPKMNISQDINSGENIVRFFPKGAGEIPFSCWMGMIRGKFIVE